MINNECASLGKNFESLERGYLGNTKLQSQIDIYERNSFKKLLSHSYYSSNFRVVNTARSSLYPTVNTMEIDSATCVRGYIDVVRSNRGDRCPFL